MLQEFLSQVGRRARGKPHLTMMLMGMTARLPPPSLKYELSKYHVFQCCRTSGLYQTLSLKVGCVSQWWVCTKGGNELGTILVFSLSSCLCIELHCSLFSYYNSLQCAAFSPSLTTNNPPWKLLCKQMWKSLITKFSLPFLFFFYAFEYWFCVVLIILLPFMQTLMFSS